MGDQPSPLEVAQRALDRLSRLQRVTAALAQALTPRGVAEVVVNQGIEALDAQSGRVSLLRDDEGRVEVVGYSGYTHVASPFAITEALPTNEVLRTGQPLFVSTHAEVAARFPRYLEMVDPRLEGALASAPLVFEGHVLGALTLAFDRDRAFDADDRELFVALATQCAQALERSRLYELSLSVQEDLRRSRDQLAAILSGIAEGVTVQDVQGRVVYANQVAAALSGYTSPDAFLRESSRVLEWLELLDEEGRPILPDQLPGRRVLHGLPTGELILQFRDRRTGERRWSVVNAAAVTDEQGRLQMVVNIFRDITERHRQFEATELLVAASTVLGSTLDLNGSLQQVAELAVQQIADRCTIELVGGDRPARVAALAVAELDRPVADREAGSEISVPLVARGETLGSLTLAYTRSPPRYPRIDRQLAENLASRIALAVDNARLLSEAQEQAEHHAVLNVALRESIEERNRALWDLQEALNSRDEFLTSASHDLKNPLSSIKATAQLLLRRLDRPDQIELDRLREGLHRVDAIASRAAGLVEELVDLTRLQLGRPLDLERQPTDLVALAREVVSEHQQASERHTLEVQAEDAELVGSWDGRRLGRVLSNLLDNAVKYSPDGGPVVVRVQRSAGWATLSVADNGVGIPPAELDRVFQRFQRGSNVAERIGGSGIGLASARHIVESHGGSIHVESEEGRGATFVVRLPLEDP